MSSWAWLEGLDRMVPVLANAFGDVFLRDQDGSFSFLDTVDGSLARAWPDAAALQAAINTREVQDEYLLAHLVRAAGLEPGPEQVLSFRIPPVLGGELSVENIELADFVVSVNVAGQVHEQVRALPPGTPVTDIRID